MEIIVNEHHQNVVEYLNDRLGADKDAFAAHGESLLHQGKNHLTDLRTKYELLEEEKPRIEAQAKKEATEIVQRIRQLRKDQRKLASEAASHLGVIEPLIDQLKDHTKDMERLEAARQILAVLIKAESYCEFVREKVSGGFLHRDAVEDCLEKYDDLLNLTDFVRHSPYEHVAKIVKDRTHEVYSILEEHLTRKFNQAMEDLGWPTPQHQLTQHQWNTENQEAFIQAFADLLSLQQPLREQVSDTPQSSPPLLPISLMMLPIARRFRFHFETKRETNQREKPEWYLTFILNTVRDHTLFLCNFLQPIANDRGLAMFDLKLEFMEQILKLAERKLLRELPFLLSEPSLFTHTINEVITFEAALREVHGFPLDKPGCLKVLTDNRKVFNEWLNMELTFFTKKMKTIFDDPDAWNFQYEEMDRVLLDVDDFKAATCANTFVILLESVTERYRVLPDITHRLRFFDSIQCQLLDYFVDELKAQKALVLQGFGKVNYLQCCKLLNSAIYCKDVLAEWGEDIFFLELWSAAKAAEEAAEVEGSKSPSDFSVNLKGTAFDSHISSLLLFTGDLMDRVVEVALSDFVRAMKPYTKMRSWSFKRFQRDLDKLDVTPEFCEALATLKSLVTMLHAHLAPSLFEEILRTLGSLISEEIWNRIILAHQFDTLGAIQFRYDCWYLFSIFKPYSARPDNLFKRVKEALILLSLQDPNSELDVSSLITSTLVTEFKSTTTSSKTLRTVSATLLNPGKDADECTSVLEDLGIYLLTPEEAQKVLLRHIDVAA